MSVMNLAHELYLAKFHENFKACLRAARFYRGLETEETLRQSNVSDEMIDYFKKMR